MLNPKRLNPSAHCLLEDSDELPGITVPVDKELRLGWEVKVDDIVEEGYVQTPGRHVCGDEDGRFACSELPNVDFASCL